MCVARKFIAPSCTQTSEQVHFHVENRFGALGFICARIVEHVKMIVSFVSTSVIDTGNVCLILLSIFAVIACEL